MALASIITLCYTITFTTLAFTVPGYLSFKACEVGDYEITRQWCCYWVVMGSFYCLQLPLDILLSWLRLYYLMKLVFVIALWYPSLQLAQPIYNKILSPVMSAVKPNIDVYYTQGMMRIMNVCGQVLDKLVASLQLASGKASNRLTRHHGVQQQAVEPTGNVDSPKFGSAAAAVAATPATPTPAQAPATTEDEGINTEWFGYSTEGSPGSGIAAAAAAAATTPAATAATTEGQGLRTEWFGYSKEGIPGSGSAAAATATAQEHGLHAE